jgi:hypothetical protein
MLFKNKYLAREIRQTDRPLSSLLNTADLTENTDNIINLLHTLAIPLREVVQLGV